MDFIGIDWTLTEQLQPILNVAFSMKESVFGLESYWNRPSIIRHIYKTIYELDLDP